MLPVDSMQRPQFRTTHLFCPFSYSIMSAEIAPKRLGCRPSQGTHPRYLNPILSVSLSGCGGASLHAPHMQPRSGVVDLIPPQFDQFRSAQAMPEATRIMAASRCRFASPSAQEASGTRSRVAPCPFSALPAPANPGVPGVALAAICGAFDRSPCARTGWPAGPRPPPWPAACGSESLARLSVRGTGPVGFNHPTRRAIISALTR
jgi:hypothetical protein